MKRIHPRATAAFVLLLAALLHSAVADAITRGWAQVTGSAGVAANWIPAGIPGSADDLTIDSGVTPCTITFPASVPTSHSHDDNGGTVGIICSSPHTITTRLLVEAFGVGTSDFSLGSGQLYAGTFGMTGPPNGGHVAFNVGNQNAHFETTDTTGLNILGDGWHPAFRVLGGGVAHMRGIVQVHACSLFVSGGGSPQAIRSTLTLDSPWIFHPGDPVASSLSIYGFAGGDPPVVNVTLGGRLDVKGATQVGGDFGFVGKLRAGDNSGVFNPLITQRGPLYLGRQPNPARAGGEGTLELGDHGILNALDVIHVGAVNYANGTGRVNLSGSCTVNAADSVIFNSMPNPSLDFRGGVVTETGGAFAWRQSGFPLSISSTVGTPVLALLNGRANTPLAIAQPALQPALRIGGFGTGTLRLGRSGTTFSVATGACVLGDSTGGNGTLLVDSLAKFTTTSSTVKIGRVSTGTVEANHGGAFAAHSVAIATLPGSAGTLRIIGAGSSGTAADSLDVGGYANVAGGTGSVVIDSGAVLSVGSAHGGRPKTYLYSGTGTMTVGPGALFTTTGWILDGHLLTLAGGTLHAGTSQGEVTIATSGILAGNGLVEGPVQDFGLVMPSGAGLSFHDTLYTLGRLFDGTSVQFQATGGFVGYGVFHCDVDSRGDFGPNPFDVVNTTRVAGNYAQASSGTLRSRLGDRGSRSCDRLEDSLGVSLAGTLALSPTTGFVPVAGDSYVVVTCASRTGTFDHVTWYNIDASPFIDVVYLPNKVVVVLKTNLAGIGPISGEAPLALRFASVGAPHGSVLVLDLPSAAEARVTLFDVAGREVARLHDGPLTAGSHRFALASSRLADGVYFARAALSGGVTRQLSARVAVVR